MARGAVIASFVAALAVAPGAARAEEHTGDHEPPVALAAGAGAGLAIVPLLAGGVLFASSDDDGLRRTGAYVAMAGLVIAPTVAHLIVREWKRAAIFGALPLAALITTAAVFAYDGKATTYGSPETRTIFGVALTAATLGATVGLVDTFAAGDRWRARHRVVLAPAVGPSAGGATLGGTF